MDEPEITTMTLADAYLAMAQQSKGVYEQAVAVPASWKLVPIEPTPEMVQAASAASSPGAARATYARMLAAAPEAPGVPVSEAGAS